MTETGRMRESAVLLAFLTLVLGPELLRAQEQPPQADREAAAHLRATVLETPVGRELTIALRSGVTFEASLADVGDDSFGVWVTPDEETKRRLGISGARIKKRILYEEVESIQGGEDVANVATTAERLAYRMRFGDTVYVRRANGATVKGRVTDFDGDVLHIDDRTLSLSGSEGDKIERIDLRVEDSLKNGVLIGAGIGASLVTLACLSDECGGGGYVVVGAVLYAGIGAGLGALFDILLNDRELIYVAPDSRSGLKLLAAPILSQDRKGILISISS